MDTNLLMEKLDQLTTKFSKQTTTEVCAVEELAELIQAVQHVIRGRSANLAEEMAHVTIMIESLRKKHSISPLEIMRYEQDMVDRYLNDRKWDGSHAPSTISDVTGKKKRYRIMYTHNGNEYEVTFDDYGMARDKCNAFRADPDYTNVYFFEE